MVRFMRHDHDPGVKFSFAQAFPHERYFVPLAWCMNAISRSAVADVGRGFHETKHPSEWSPFSGSHAVEQQAGRRRDAVYWLDGDQVSVL